jgi:proteic killer suppression protein
MFHWTRCSLCGGDAVEDFEQRVTVPGISRKSAAELVGDTSGLGHGESYLFNSIHDYTVLMYTNGVIVSFGDATTADVYHGRDTKAARKLSRETWARIQRKLDLLNACTSLEDLRVPPANRLEKLKGDLAGFHSIRVNDQYRVVFRFITGHCSDVRCTDYH